MKPKKRITLDQSSPGQLFWPSLDLIARSVLGPVHWLVLWGENVVQVGITPPPHRELPHLTSIKSTSSKKEAKKHTKAYLPKCIQVNQRSTIENALTMYMYRYFGCMPRQMKAVKEAMLTVTKKSRNF